MDGPGLDRRLCAVLATSGRRIGDVAASNSRLAEAGSIRFSAIRLDSGDLAADARAARRALDAAGLGEVRILASGNLDEDRIDDVTSAGAPIDAPPRGRAPSGRDERSRSS